MSQRAPSLVSDTHYCVVGDVTIDATAAIAPGVVLQAIAGSRIVVSKGVCLSAGVCLQARKGILLIESGASLGANVLIVGHGIVGANACISAGSTLVDPAVEAETILPPGTLAAPSQGAKATPVQDFSVQNRDANNGFSQVNSVRANSAQANPVRAYTFIAPEPVGPKPVQIPDIPQQANRFVSPPPLNQPFGQSFNPVNGQGTAQASHQENFGGGYGTLSNNVQSNYPLNDGNGNGANGNPANGAHAANGSSSLSVPASFDRVYGREQVSQLISTLFPHRQSLDNSQS